MLAVWWCLVRFGFRLLYNELALTYDVVSQVVSLGAWRCWQRTALPFLSNPGAGVILELAHGTGNLQLDLYDAGYRVVGYDLSAHMGRIAHRKLTRAGHVPVLARGLAQSLPFPDEKFSSVVCTFPTPFILSPKTLREVYRVLQPGGQLVVVMNGVLTGGDAIAQALESLYRITGQRSQQATNTLLVPFENAGLQATTKTVQCPHSEALLVIARRPPSPNSA